LRLAAPIFVYFLHVVFRFPRLLPLIIPLLPKEKTFRIRIANYLLEQDHAVLALQYLQKTSSINRPSIDENFLHGLCLYKGLGRLRDAVSVWSSANTIDLQEARRLGLGASHFRVLDNAWARHIGDLAMIDYVIKLGVLEGRSPEDTILYLPTGSAVANRFLLQQIATKLRQIDDPAALPFAASALQALHFDMLGPCLPDGRTVYCWEAAAKSHKRWQDECKPPLFKLPPETVERGWDVLRGAGMPQEAWFVALHVRQGRSDRNIHAVRNADPSTYHAAISEITDRGGWVIRMGDPSMTALPPRERVIDYCHTNLRTDWMDIFILACCRFMIGTMSGPAFVPSLYGVPAVLTNWWPPAQRPFQRSNIFIPKMLRRIADGRCLTMSEMLREPFSYCHSLSHLAHQGVRIEDNDSAVIRDAVVQMLERLDGHQVCKTQLAEARVRADQIFEDHEAYGMAELADEFIERHADLIS
jgi:putative glycosyltransferase (TIGR04372 family)